MHLTLSIALGKIIRSGFVAQVVLEENSIRQWQITAQCLRKTHWVLSES